MKLPHRRLLLCSSSALLLVAGLRNARADEGMWTFDSPPSKLLAERYGFEPSAAWLEHVRLASLRVNDGGSGSFISPHGLVLTNHHVGFNAIQKLSSEERDLVADGFYAPAHADELPCTDLELNVLQGIEDVTARVIAAGGEAATEAEGLAAREAEIARIEKEASERTGLRCNVIELYRGGRYSLYFYKRYTDVRLVFAPHQQSAFFGGDPDNFNYPRYCLDMAIFRVWEDGAPAATPHYFRWNSEGASEGDLVFVSGNPGSTGRLLTLAQLELLRDVVYPRALGHYGRRRDALAEYSARGPEEERRARNQLFGIENAIKAIGGYHESLAEGKGMGRKAAEEKRLRSLVAEDPELAAEVGAAWDAIATAQEVALEIGTRHYFSRIRGSRLFSHARDIVRLVAELEKPDEERKPRYRDSNRKPLELGLYSEAPVYLDFEEAMLNAGMAEITAQLGADDPFVKAMLSVGGPVEASFPIGGTKLVDPAFRRSLVEGGTDAVEGSDDPLIRLALAVDPVARALERRMEDEVDAVESKNGQLIARARFAAFGTDVYPDATFTLRLSYGAVKGYAGEGGLGVPFKTTLYGLYDREASFEGQPPYELPELWKERRSSLDLATPINFVCTADIIGGNSGSPVIDREGDLVGLIFDGNIQSLGNRFVFDDTIARSVAVHTGGMLEALERVYAADALVAEIRTAAEK